MEKLLISEKKYKSLKSGEYKIIENMNIFGQNTLIDNSIYKNCVIKCEKEPTVIIYEEPIYNCMFIDCTLKIKNELALCSHIAFSAFFSSSIQITGAEEKEKADVIHFLRLTNCFYDTTIDFISNNSG